MSSISFDCVTKLEIDDDEVFEAVRKDFNPEEVFGVDELEDWAFRSGFVRESDLDV